MILTIDEKEKLLHKASELYEKIKNINIKNTIELDIPCKYYPSDIRYGNSGFKYYANGTKGVYIYIYIWFKYWKLFRRIAKLY